MTAPTLRLERDLLRDLPAGARLAAIDEVGRGALAGPVAVGVVVMSADAPAAPRGVRDSKDCPPAQRRALVPRIRSWALSCAVGMATSREIDERGIVGALSLSAARALNTIGDAPQVILLDGKHDWIAPVGGAIPVVTRVGGDRQCAAVAAASILAKVMRDDLMARLSASYPAYGWDSNRGYAAPHHVAAIERLGTTPHHRLSWRLPGTPSARR